ncbi:WAT1-related At2g39510-like [Olea europaea subsp. europaea]|uniref:WAT1-related protein n=1 Tax=Olea europaea subsp. europaea TaxID=158383 RepID=A0A8S0V569_OLEEU|nr:WAT1-related At2g39510-like [Olea europaea subsp. europaea]
MATFAVGSVIPGEKSQEASPSTQDSKYLILAVVLLRFAFAGLAIIAKSALAKGMSPFTFAVYRNAIATVTFAPFALIFERSNRPSLTLSILCKIILLGLLGVIEQDLYYTGMKHTTATFATALYNVLPVITFVLSWILRQENVNFKSLHGYAKLFGTLVTFGGSMVMTVIKGPLIGLPWTKHRTNIADVNPQNPILGSIMILTACCCWAYFHILQAEVLQSLEPSKFELSLTTLICAMATVESSITTLVVERGNAAIWSIHLDIKLLAYFYGGIICSGVAYYIAGIVMKKKGPVFVTSFNPLTMVIVAVMGSFIFAEELDLGKVAGAIIIVIGLYLVLWGKSEKKDQNISSVTNPSTLSDGSLATTDDGVV